jgi:hypothetical protein
MGSQKGKAETATGKIEKVRIGVPTLVRSDKPAGGKNAVAFKPPTKPKPKDTLRDGAPKKKATK